MNEPMTHIQRSPLPWRESDYTECGQKTSEFAKVVSREEAKRRANEYGRQRFSLFFCMTCTQTFGRWPAWEDDPVERYFREGRGETRTLLVKELRAFAALIEAHRDEFDAFVEGLDQTADLAARRAAKPRGPRVVPGAHG